MAEPTKEPAKPATQTVVTPEAPKPVSKEVEVNEEDDSVKNKPEITSKIDKSGGERNSYNFGGLNSIEETEEDK